MSHDVGIWIDHKKAVIVSIADGGITVSTVDSQVGAHPHFAGSQEGGGEKKYEERQHQQHDRFYDDVIRQMGQPAALFLFGPGEAKMQLKERLGRSRGSSQRPVAIATADRLTDPQIVARVKAHYGLDR